MFENFSSSKTISSLLLFSGIWTAPLAKADANSELLSMLNSSRANAGQAGFTELSALDRVAYAHSQDMCQRNFRDHVNPDGRNPGDRLTSAGITMQSWGENIYWGSGTSAAPSAAHNWWMNSPGHKANILGNFNKIGIGIYYCAATSETIYTNVFIRSESDGPGTSPWFLGTWNCSIDGRPSTIIWNKCTSGANCVAGVYGQFKESLASHSHGWVDLRIGSYNANAINFTYTGDNTPWFLTGSSNYVSGHTTWNGNQYPLSCSR